MKMTNKMISAIMITGVLSFVGADGAPNPQDDSQSEIQKINVQFVRFQQALSARDSAALGDLYLAEAMSLLQNQPARKGRVSIEARWKQSLTGPFILSLASEEINLSSSRQEAYQRGTFEIHSTDPSAALLASGKWLYLWRKESDRWRIALEMDNFNSPKAQKPSAR